MTDFKERWNLDMTLQVLQQEMIDSESRAAATKWLLLYGPPEIRNMLQQAADIAIRQCFMELESKIYTRDGEPCYDIRGLAVALGLNEGEVIEKMREMEKQYGVQHLFAEDETQGIQ
jgi:hypothetical protein